MSPGDEVVCVPHEQVCPACGCHVMLRDVEEFPEEGRHYIVSATGLSVCVRAIEMGRGPGEYGVPLMRASGHTTYWPKCWFRHLRHDDTDEEASTPAPLEPVPA